MDKEEENLNDRNEDELMTNIDSTKLLKEK